LRLPHGTKRSGCSCVATSAFRTGRWTGLRTHSASVTWPREVPNGRRWCWKRRR
jgi:hypothetical protein